MRHIILLTLIFFTSVCLGQTPKIIGAYSAKFCITDFRIVFNADSTFIYTSDLHPNFYRLEKFVEKGQWTLSSDTIILNPQLSSKPFIETDFQEAKAENDSLLYLTINHIIRQFAKNGNIISIDTLQVGRLDYSFNEFKKKKMNRVAERPTINCAFEGHIPPETITSERTIEIVRPLEKLESVFIGCYEMQGTKEFKIKNPNSNHLTLNIFSNYYLDGQLRQKKILIKNEKILYTKQKHNGKFDRGNWYPETLLIKEKSGS